MLAQKLLRSMPPLIQDVAHSLDELCQRIETLSQRSIFHPSKCRCLAKSYSVLIRYVLSLTVPYYSSSSHSLHLQLSALFNFLLHILQEGERFIQNAADQRYKQWLIPGRSAHQRRLLINKALTVAFSTEVVDVHLHDLVWCISTLIWVLADCSSDTGLDVRIQADRVHALIKETWALADEEDDVKSMQALVRKTAAKGHYTQISDLICHRLSESTSEAKLNLTHAVVPSYLLMDPDAFENMNDRVIDSNEVSVVFETRFMGGRFACKHFYDPDATEFFFAHEAMVQARLRHENVVHLVCCSKQASGFKSLSLVTELMDTDLHSLILERRLAGMDVPFSLLEHVDLMLQIAKGMEYLHGLNIMHCDLKCSNILVSQSKHASYLGERGHLRVKIADFGTAKIKHDAAPFYSTKSLGTRIWRAPEVLHDEDEAKDTKMADVYSFAMICYQILTGLPANKLSPCNRFKVLNEGRRPKLPSSCPSAISSYIENCSHRNASERPTFKQICRVFRFFKACILSRETELLASPLQDDIFDFEELLGPVADKQSESMCYHPVLDIPFEMLVVGSVWKQKRRVLLKHQELKRLVIPGQGIPMEILVSKLLCSNTQVIGEGSLGTAYKCQLEDGSSVFVRRLRKGIIVRNKQLVDMVKLKHDNLVPLLAHWYTEEEDVLVFEYVKNGRCLSGLLHGNIISDWNTRLRVALGAAIGIDYLHDHGYIHGHIKPSNILLVDTSNRCVFTDYGLLRATPEYLGYRAPHELRFTKEADVYSYGLLLLELSTGRNPEENSEVLLWVESLAWEEQIKIFGRTVHKGLDKQEEMLQIALKCLDSNPSQRPAIKQVVKMIAGVERPSVH